MVIFIVSSARSRWGVSSLSPSFNQARRKSIRCWVSRSSWVSPFSARSRLFAKYRRGGRSHFSVDIGENLNIINYVKNAQIKSRRFTIIVEDEKPLLDPL